MSDNERSLMGRVKLAAVFTLGLLVVVLIMQNTDPVATKILFSTITMPRAVLLFLTLAIGFVLGAFACVMWKRKAEKEHG